jgi:MFS family permease
MRNPVRQPPEAARMSGLAVFLRVFVPFAFAHYLACLLRTVNAVLAPGLVASLALDPAQLGLLTSAFFLAFALAQLPVGIALERHGPRKVQLVLLLVAAAGALLFAHGRSFAELVVARAVIGCGVGGSFAAALNAVSRRIAPARLPSLQGWLTAVGGLGAASATTPVRVALQTMDWRSLFVLFAAMAAGAAFLIRLAAPGRDDADAAMPTVRSVFAVYRDPAFRRAVALLLIPHTVFFGIQGLWFGRWLSDVARLPDAEVAWLLALSMAGVIGGAIAVGTITEWLGRHGIAALDVACAGVLAFVLVQVAIVLGWRPSLPLLTVLFTLVGTVSGLEYAIVAQTVPRPLAGRAATCLNLSIFVGAFLAQAGFGLVVGLWRPDAAGHYPEQAYRTAFGLLVLLQLPGLAGHLLSCFRHRPQVKCGIALIAQKEDYEIGSLRPPR